MKASRRRRGPWGQVAIWVAIWLAGFFALIATRNFGVDSAWPALLWSVACLVAGLMAMDRMRGRRPRR